MSCTVGGASACSQVTDQNQPAERPFRHQQPLVWELTRTHVCDLNCDVGIICDPSWSSPLHSQHISPGNGLSATRELEWRMTLVVCGGSPMYAEKAGVNKSPLFMLGTSLADIQRLHHSSCLIQTGKAPNSYTYDSDISATHTHILCSCINSPLVYRVLIGVRTPFGVEVFDMRICERPLHTTSVKLLVVV